MVGFVSLHPPYVILSRLRLAVICRPECFAHLCREVAGRVAVVGVIAGGLLAPIVDMIFRFGFAVVPFIFTFYSGYWFDSRGIGLMLGVGAMAFGVAGTFSRRI